MKTWNCGSVGPNTLPPLASCRALPSQKLSKLNATPNIVGVLRGSTRRKPWNSGIGSLTSDCRDQGSKRLHAIR